MKLVPNLTTNTMSPLSRRRLSSTGDSSAPPSESSEGSEHGADHGHVGANGGYWGSSQRVGSALRGRAVMDDGHIMSDLQMTAGTVQEHERLQIEAFFSGLGTQVFVSGSLANLYESGGTSGVDWVLRYTGVPVLLHDSGKSRARCRPRIQVLLAERGSCFTLWRDTVDHLSDYRVAGPSFHTMCLSTDHRVVMGFSFDSTQAAKETWSRIERLISDPENICLSVPGRKKKKTKPQPDPRPPKSQISIPCQFQHVISVGVGDRGRYFSLQALVDQPREQSTTATLG